MTSTYGKGQYCPPEKSPLLRYAKPAKAKCLRLDELSHVLAKSRDFDELVEAWRGWHAIAAPMKDRSTRATSSSRTQGAKEIGFGDVGALWRAGYDMPPADFEADVERLWSDVKPLYDALHCYVRAQAPDAVRQGQGARPRAHPGASCSATCGRRSGTTSTTSSSPTRVSRRST